MRNSTDLAKLFDATSRRLQLEGVAGEQAAHHKEKHEKLTTLFRY
jgi:hypothetical protein